MLPTASPHLLIRELGLQPYLTVWRAMQDFTAQRDATTNDEIWVVEHPPVFTQGQAGKAEHLLTASNIEVVQSDRGGQITYHGPGQAVVYILLDLKRRAIGVRQLVSALEQAVIALLATWQISAYARADAPGVYVDGAKICSLGLRVRKGCTFHGLALNIKMDLTPFTQINPCGYAGMIMTQMAAQNPQAADVKKISRELISQLAIALGYPQDQLKFTDIEWMHAKTEQNASRDEISQRG